DADEVATAIRAAHRGELQLDPAVAGPLMSSLRERAGPAAYDGAARLTPRELDVVNLGGEGTANEEIARELGIGERTARTHVSSALRKLQLTSRTQLALWAVGEGLASVDAGHAPSIVEESPPLPASGWACSHDNGAVFHVFQAALDAGC